MDGSGVVVVSVVVIGGGGGVGVWVLEGACNLAIRRSSKSIVVVALSFRACNEIAIRQFDKGRC